MASRVLIAYATMYGSTEEVAGVVASAIRDAGFDADVRDAAEVERLDGYEAVVLGAPLIVHRLHKGARRFLSRHRKALEGLPVALFALGPCREPYDEGEWADCRAQLEAVLAGSPWLRPVTAELFGGRFDPALLKFPFNRMAGTEPASDARDWGAIEDWASGLPELFSAIVPSDEGSSA